MYASAHYLQNFKIEVTLDIKLSDTNVKSQISDRADGTGAVPGGALSVEVAFVNTPTKGTLTLEGSWGRMMKILMLEKATLLL